MQVADLPLQGSYHNDYRQVGTSGRMRIHRIKLVAAAALLASALVLGGCSATIADLPALGTPADAPGHPKEAGSYLPVHDLPPNREEEAMKPAEQAKIEAELIAARDRQASAAAAKPDAK
jgi:hypothetical protein